MKSIKIPFKFGPTPIMYLVIVDKLAKDRAELFKVRPTEKFFDMVHEQVMAHALEGKAPPAQIASAVMNISDDVMAGREPVIRAGDYMALMEFARSKKIV
jgi:hypothetical protein